FGGTTSTTSTVSTIGVVLAWDVSADVADFLAGVPNFGWLVKDAAEGAGGVEFQFVSRQNPTVASRPQLVVAYGPCSGPPPSTRTPTATPTPTLPTTTFGAAQDAWIAQDNVTQNKGTDTGLRVKAAAGKVRRTLVQFDLSAVPPSSCIAAAALELTLTQV